MPKRPARRYTRQGAAAILGRLILCTMAGMAALGCKAQTTPFNIDEVARTLKVESGLLYNQAGDECEARGFKPPCFRGRIKLRSPVNLITKGWSLYFSSPSFIHTDLSDAFDIQHVNGDLYRLRVSPEHAGLQRQLYRVVQEGVFEYRIDYLGSNWQLSEFDVLPNYYLVDETGKRQIIAATRPQIDPQSGEEWLPHARKLVDYQKQGKRTEADRTPWAGTEWQFNRNQKRAQNLSLEPGRIIPAMQQVRVTEGQLALTKGIAIDNHDWELSGQTAALAFIRQLGIDIVEKTSSTKKLTPLLLSRDTSIRSAEGYRLTISAAGMEVAAATERGLFYGLISLSALIDPVELTLPFLQAEDAPRFGFRGLHLDVARHFRSRDWVIRLLDQMAYYKLNKLHLHLGDDEGWRLAVKGLPELTQVGARQCHDLTEQTCLIPQLGHGPKPINHQFYSREDYLAILEAAKARKIQVIPSFDMPGHSRASIKAMDVAEQRLEKAGLPSLRLSEPEDRSHYYSVQYFTDNTLNVCQASTYRFIETIVAYLKALHQDAQAPLSIYHIGADETAGAWTASPACQRLMEAESITAKALSGYFLRRVTRILKKQGVIAGGWSDGMSHLLHDENMPGNQVNVWEPLYWQGQRQANRFANRGWQVILSFPDVTYFDFPYESHPTERGYYWGARAIDTRKVFEWMPENLPLHAEIWRDRENNPWQVDEVQTSDWDEEKQTLRPGVRFAGIQGHLWGEQIRSDQIAERMLMPRLLALAERAWHRPGWEPEYRHQGGHYGPDSHYFDARSRAQRETDWQQFSSRLVTRELPRLAKQQWFFRMPTAGAKRVPVKDGFRLLMNAPLPGLTLSWRQNNGPWQTWDRQNPPVIGDKDARIQVRTQLPDTSRVSAARQLDAAVED